MNKSKLNTVIGIIKIILALTISVYEITFSINKYHNWEKLFTGHTVLILIIVIVYIFCFYLFYSGWTQIKGIKLRYILLFWFGSIIGAFIIWQGIEMLLILGFYQFKIQILVLALLIFSMINDFLRLYVKRKIFSSNIENYNTTIVQRKTKLYTILVFLTVLIGIAIYVSSGYEKQKRLTPWSERINNFIGEDTTLESSQISYELRMGRQTPEFTNVFYKHVDSLAHGLALLFNDKTVKEYRNLLFQARIKGDEYFLIKKDISPSDYETLKTLPLVRLGSNGIMLEKKIDCH